jgi:hypothetical protein
MVSSLNEKVKVTEAKEKDKLLVWKITMWFKLAKHNYTKYLNKRIK